MLKTGKRIPISLHNSEEAVPVTTVLIVEDTELNSKQFRLIVKMLGYDFIEASNGEEGTQQYVGIFY